MTSPLFSIIIPTCRRNDTLVACLRLLAPGAQNLKCECYEIIVSDDGKQESTRELVENGGTWSSLAKWVPGPSKGPAANRNNGSTKARGQWLVFTDDDCLPTSEWLESFEKIIKDNPSINVLEGRTYADRPRISFDEVSPINENGGLLWSCNLAIKHELFNSMGGFDERFPFAAMEDVELKYRLDQQKETICFVREAAVCHPWRKDAGWKGHLKHERSMLVYLSLHPDEFNRINTYHFLKCVPRLMLKDTLPGVWRYRGRGLYAEILRHAACLRAAFVIGLARRKARSNIQSQSVEPKMTSAPARNIDS